MGRPARCCAPAAPPPQRNVIRVCATSSFFGGPSAVWKKKVRPSWRAQPNPKDSALNPQPSPLRVPNRPTTFVKAASPGSASVHGPAFPGLLRRYTLLQITPRLVDGQPVQPPR